MKKILSSLILISLLAVPVIGLAQAETAPTIDVMVALTRVTNWLFAILLIIAVIYIILAAYNFITAGGDPAKVQMARSNLMYALIGVAVALLARGLVALVRTIIGG